MSCTAKEDRAFFWVTTGLGLVMVVLAVGAVGFMVALRLLMASY